MKLAVVGSRTFPIAAVEYEKLSGEMRESVLRQGRQLVRRVVSEWLLSGSYTQVVSGAAAGPDSWGVQCARELHIPCVEIPADWRRYGKRAGFLRNEDIVRRSEAVLAFWDGVSRGTLDTIRKAHARGLPVTVVFGDGSERSNRCGDS